MATYYLGVVMFTNKASIDDAEPVPRYKAAMALHTGETIDVVDVALCLHHHLTRGDLLTARRARPRTTKHSEIVIFTQDHASLGEAGLSVLPELRLTARALEAGCVPVTLHGV